jgi:predicted nucleic acid-binding protein
MSYWDSSALIKLYVQEFDSAAFRAFAAKATRVVTASLTRHEMRTVFWRREAEGVLLSGEAAVLYGELNADIAAADILIQAETVAVEREFGVVLEKCFSQAPAATFIRTNDALHLASAKIAGELEFVTGDVRQRTAALLLGFTVLP